MAQRDHPGPSEPLARPSLSATSIATTLARAAPGRDGRPVSAPSTDPPAARVRRGSRLVRRLLVLEIVTVVLTAVIAGGVSAWSTRQTIERDAADKVLAVSVALAASPGLADAVAARDVPRIQAAAEATRAGTGVSFVTVMDPAGTRLSHPEPARIGETYQGTFLPAAGGATLVETFPGTLGLSVRAIVPVLGADGTVVGMVAAGQLRVQVADRIARELAVLALAAAVAIALGVGLAWLAARRVKRDTLGLEPHEITALHRHHEAVMAAMREGLLVLDADSGRVVVLNAEAARLLGLPATLAPSRAAGPTLDELGVDPALRERLADRSPVTDETMLVGERLLLVNRAEVAGPAPDLVVTLRDRTELEAMTRELDDARSVTRALRFAAHEHANHLQAVSTLIELGAQDDARDLAQRWTRDLLDAGDGATGTCATVSQTPRSPPSCWTRPPTPATGASRCASGRAPRSTRPTPGTSRPRPTASPSSATSSTTPWTPRSRAPTTDGAAAWWSSTCTSRTGRSSSGSPTTGRASPTRRRRSRRAGPPSRPTGGASASPSCAASSTGAAGASRSGRARTAAAPCSPCGCRSAHGPLRRRSTPPRPAGSRPPGP